MNWTWCRFVVVLVIVFFEKCGGFNLDLNFVEIVETGRENGYFGYSVLLQKGDVTSSVIVGAPKSNSSFPNHRQIREPGALFKCDIGIKDSCKQYVVDREANSEYKGNDNRFSYKNRKDGGMLGTTVDGGENVGDSFVVCSPKWANERTDRNGQHFLANGMCYLIGDSRNLNETGEKLMPLLDSGKQGYTMNTVKYYYAIGEVGMSIQYLSKEQELLLGAPGVLSWRGSVVRYRTLTSNNFIPQQRSAQPQFKKPVYSKIDVPNPVYISSLTEDSLYFGYSVSSGVFNKRNPGRLWYVSGAPRALDLLGLVLVYEFSTKNDADLLVRERLIGDQMGAYFGAAVLSIDLGSGVADLLVGAPTYFIETWDEGCVYYYKNYGQGHFASPLKIFGKKQHGARFGTTISRVGDINQDTYQDVAISAPYEDDGQGAVYIYLGGKNGLSAEYSQKISAKTLSAVLRGFGFSVSNGVDIDQNFYDDVAIGAFKSGQVAIVKSRPVIKYFAELTSSLRELSVDTTKFNVTYCISYTNMKNTVERVATFVQIIKDSRTTDNGMVTNNITLIKGQTLCGNIDITLRGGNSDYSKPYTIEMTYKTADASEDEFCPTCAVSDPNDSKSKILVVPFANGCGSDNICQPDLKLIVHLDNKLDHLVIGTLTKLKLNIHVENTGEPAYLCQVHMKLPVGVEINRISSKCELGEDRIYHCLVDNVLQQNEHKELVWDLDVTNLNPNDNELFFNVTADSRGEEINSLDNVFLISLPLRLENQMEISGKSFPDQIVYVDEENNVRSEVVDFNHEFSVKNLGPSPLAQIELWFNFPVELDIEALTKKVAFDIYEPKVYINSQRIKCTTDYPGGFFNNQTKIEGESSEIGEEQTGALLGRLRRNADFESQSSTVEQLSLTDTSFDLPMNRTIFVNCSRSDIKCMQVKCVSEEMMDRNQYIKAAFSIRAHVDTLQQTLENKDIIVISSTVESNVNGKTIQNYAKTLLIGSLTKEEVSYWIYIVCVIIAIVILAILIFVLYKLNFFNRPVREKLQNDTESSSTKKDLDDDDHDHDDDDI